METTATSPSSPTRRPGRHRARIFGFVLAGLVAVGLGLATAALAVGPPDGTLRWTWSIGDRYGLDADGDGVVDNHDGIENLAADKAFIQSPTYKLTFDTCASPAVTERSGVITGFTLTLSGPEAKTVSSTNCRIEAAVTKLGTFTAKVEIKVGPATVDTRTETITPKDQLVASVGDSVASGEGNPDVLSPGVPFLPTWQNAQCHRTGLAGPAQAALRMERRDPHSTITFVHLACSGASITEGLLGNYVGQEPKPGDPVLKPQLDQLKDLVGTRPVDAMTVSIGANDAKFSEVVKACLILKDCETDETPGQENGKKLFDKNIGQLVANYPLLDARLDKMAKQEAGDVKLAGKVFFTQYFDVTKDDDGSYCTGATAKEKAAGTYPDGTTTDGISKKEMTFADTYVQDGLNTKVKAGLDAANANGGSQWVWVDGIKPKFATHGYCAADRWIRTLSESFLYQRGKDGAFHPNAEGHLYGYATSIEDKVAPALGIGGTPLPLEPDAGTAATGDALSSWIGTLDKAGAVDAITNNLPFGSREKVQQFIRDKFFGKFLPFLQDKITKSGTKLTQLSENLDDLDGDGNPGVDAFGVAGLDLDITGDIQPKLPSKQYDVTLTFKGSVALDPELAMKAGQLNLTGQTTDGKAEIDQTVHLHIDLTKGPSDALRLTLPEDGLTGSVKLGLAADFGGTDGAANGPDKPAITFTSGVLGLKAVGPAAASVKLGYAIKDPSGDGRIDATEIGRPLDWVKVRCLAGSANLDLKASSSLAGFTTTLGTVKLADADLCDGIEQPTVDLAELGEFEGVTPAELVNGLAQLTTALKGIQSGTDIDLPFVKEGLASLISANDKLVKFFVDNGLTDPANPMANVTFDPTKRPDLDTIDELLPKMASALGVPVATLNPRVVDQRLLLDLSTNIDPTTITGAGTLDFGDQLSKTGLASVTGSAKASVDPALSLKLGLGVDLRPGLELGDRFFFQLADGPELTVDAKVTADAALDAKLALLDVDLADDNAAGPVTLLDRKDPAKPVLSVDLDGKGDTRLTLKEITAPSTTSASPLKVTVNAKVPTFGLNAVAKLGGSPFANGKVTVSWPDITKVTGADALSVTIDGNFTKTLLPFAFDTEDPRTLVVQVLTVTQSGISELRRLVASDPELVASLPLAGRSAADLDPMLAKAEAKLAELIEVTDKLTLDQAEAELEKALGQALDIANAQWPGLVTFTFQPQTDTANAALQAQLNLGICTTDRAALPGCTHTEPKVSVPLNLRLGSSVDSMAAVGADGDVSVSYDARLKLGVGIELPRVTDQTAPDCLPKKLCTLKPYILDDSSFELGVGGAVSAQFNAILGPVEVGIGSTAKPAKAAVAARYVLESRTAVPANPQRQYSLSSWISTIDPDPTTNGGLHDTAFPAACTPAADACATLPTYVNGAYAGDITFTAPDLLAPSGWQFDADAVTNSLSSESFQFAVMLDGLRSFTERLENSLRAMPAGTKIPLLGGDPTKGADVLADFRTGVIDPFQQLVNTLNAANNAAAVRNGIQTFLFDKIGPTSSLKLLRDGPDAGTDITKADIEVSLECKIDGTVKTCADGDAATKLDDLQVKLPLAKAATVTSKPFESGFPGLRLSSHEGFSAGVGFELDLAFGIDRTNGFYIPTNAFGSQPELRVQATASMPSSLDAEIAFIPARITDLRPDQPDVAATLGVDLAAGGSDAKVTLGQLGSVRITPSVSACANVQLGLATNADKKFPSFKADLKMTGGLNCTAGGVTGAPASSSFGITFDNVRVNAGSLITDFINPAVTTVRKYTGPLEPTIDALRKPIPGVAQAARAAGRPAPTWWDLMNAINDIRMGAGEPDQLAMIKKVIFVSDLARDLSGTTTGAMGDISLGSFNLNVDQASKAASAGTIDGLMGSATEAGGSTPIINRLNAAGVPLQLADKLKPTTPYNSLTFPAFERPQRLFELLLGKDVPLVRFEAGGSFLHVPIGPYSFPVGPATVYFGGALDLSGHFAAGFDTYGVRQAFSMLTDDDPSNDGFGQVAAGLLGGFYLDDYDANGKDVPELRAQAEVTVGAGVGIPGFGVFAEGGVHGDAQLDLKTEADGKLRPEQIVKQLRKNPNPVCMFKAQARIDAFVRVVVSNPIKDVVFPIADAVVLDEPDLTAFCNTQQSDSQPKLTGSLYADGTLELFSSAASDRILVTQRSVAGTVDVSSKGVVETFVGVKKVFVDGAAGDDQITITSDSPRAGTISVYACGGAGKDGIQADTGPATLYGDVGPASSTVENGVPKPLPCAAGPGAADTVQGGPDADKLSGGDGNDSLLAGGGADQLKGDNGDDVLVPGTGDDTLDGTAGSDVISASDRTDADMTIDLRPGKASGATGTSEKDMLTSIELGVGGPGNDTMYAPDAGNVLDGGNGADLLQGGPGPDLLVGSYGSDDIRGADGFDLLVGAAGDDRMVGNEGPDIYQGGEGTDTADWGVEPGPVTITLNGQADDGRADQEVKDNVADADIVIGTTKDDVLATGATAATLYGRGGDDTLDGFGVLHGENGDDLVRGSEGDDTLTGDAGKDDLAGKGGADTMDGGTDDDHLDGGFGPDSMAGGSGFDVNDYSARTGDLTIRLTDGARDGQTPNNTAAGTSPDCRALVCDEVKPDNERIIGGSGNDTLDGDLFDQQLVGGPGDDALTGHAGIDRFEGGPGKDDARDGDAAYSKPDPAGKADVYVMGDGDDSVYGSGGDEQIDLGDGNDKGALNGTGTVTLDMGPGNDTFDTDEGDHTVVGGPGDDRLATYAGKKDIDMGDGDDVVGMSLGASATRAVMGSGDDEFDGATGATDDVVDGGPGDDFLIGSGGNDVITDTEGANLLYLGAGNDRSTTGPGSDEVRGDDGDDTIVDGGNDGRPRTGVGPAQYLLAGNGNDTVTMTGATVAGTSDAITGDAGNDTVTGGAGSQSVTAGDGADAVDGGAGDDSLNGGNGDDTVKGGDGDDRVTGGDGANTLDGGPGADRIEGGGGKDTLSYAGRTAPIVVTQGGGAYDGNALDDSATSPATRDDIDYRVDTVIGTEKDDTIAVTSLASTEVATVDGRGGNDVLSSTDGASLLGGPGNDTLLGSPEVDSLDGGIGNDLLAGGAAADTEKGGDGDDRFDQGNAIDGGDTLSGGADTDVADYSARPAGQAIAFTPGAGGANDGAAGESDNIDATVESARTQANPTVAPTLTVTPARTTAAAGETIDVAVTVAGTAGTPTGAIDLLENGAKVSSANLDATGKAVARARLVNVGTKTLTATFRGDARYRPATSGGATVTVTKVNTSLRLETVASPVKIGVRPSFRVRVLPAVGDYQASGVVRIAEGATDLGAYSTSGNGTTVTLAAALPAGRHDLVATWAGDNQSNASTSAAASVLVSDSGIAPAPAVAITTNPAAPIAGAALTVKATLTPAGGALAPTGTVAFTATDPATTPATVVDLGSAPLDAGAAQVSVPAGLAGGTWQVRAAYEGSDTTAPASATKAVTVARTATTTTLVSGRNPATTDDGIAFTATVVRSAGGAVPTGTVTFLDGTTPVGSVALDGAGKATRTLPLVAGTHQVTARYDGTSLLAPSTSAAVAQVVTSPSGNAIATTTALARSGSTVTATVTPVSGTVTGKVTFSIDDVTTATVDLTAGKASTTLPALAPGNHVVVARYLGSATHAGSTSTPLTVSVAKIATTTSVVREGANVKATVTAASGTPTGTVAFTFDGTPLATVDLAGTTATAALPALTPGNHTVVATYQGSATHTGSASAPLTVATASAPSAPGIPTVTAAGRDSATLDWTAPASNGGSAVTGYRITVKVGAAATPVRTVSVGSSTSTTVTGLTAGMLHRFTVAATNGAGTGPDSALSAFSVPPFKRIDAFTDRQYRDFAGRAPTATELATWRDRLAKGTATPVALVDQAANFSMFGPKVGTITRLFNAYFLRLPDTGGLHYWVGRYRAGTTLATISNGFAGSAEFRARYGSLSNTAFVKQVYLNVLGRQPDAAGLKYWVGRLDAGASRGSMIPGFSESTEYKAKTKPITDLVSVYDGLLVRVPTSAERAQWEPQLKAGTPRTAVISAVLASPAYDARV